MQSSPESREASRCHLHFLVLPPQVIRISVKVACAHIWYLGFHDYCLEDTALDCLTLAISSRVHGFHGTVSNKETVLNYLSPEGSVQRERERDSQSSPERNIFAYFKSCYLMVQLPISIYIGADRDPPL